MLVDLNHSFRRPGRCLGVYLSITFPGKCCQCCSVVFALKTTTFIFAKVKVTEPADALFSQSHGLLQANINKYLYFVSVWPWAELRDIGRVHPKKKKKTMPSGRGY